MNDLFVSLLFSPLALTLDITYLFLIPLHIILNKDPQNNNTPEIDGCTGRQLNSIYLSVLLDQTLTKFLSIFIYMYMKDWKGSHLSNQKCCMDQ